MSYSEALENLEKPAIRLLHSSLRRSGESPYRSRCPACPNGVLFVARDEALHLSRLDRCSWCGQAFEYLDDAINDEPFAPEMQKATRPAG